MTDDVSEKSSLARSFVFWFFRAVVAVAVLGGSPRRSRCWEATTITQIVLFHASDSEIIQKD